jgi:hypothetical protein
MPSTGCSITTISGPVASQAKACIPSEGGAGVMMCALSADTNDPASRRQPQTRVQCRLSFRPERRKSRTALRLPPASELGQRLRRQLTGWRGNPTPHNGHERVGSARRKWVSPVAGALALVSAVDSPWSASLIVRPRCHAAITGWLPRLGDGLGHPPSRVISRCLTGGPSPN